MNDRTWWWSSSGLFLVAFVFFGVCAVAQTRAQVISPVDFEIRPPILQDVADPEDDVVWLPNTFTLADVNRDGSADLVAINQLDSKVLVHLSRGDGTFQDPVSLFVVDADDSELEPTSVAIGDVGSQFFSEVDGDPDGNPDIVLGTYDGTVVIFVGDGEGNFELRGEDLSALAEVIDVDLADFDGDGRLDIVALDSFDEAVVMLNQTGAFDPTTDSFCTGGEEATAIEVAAGDFDSDRDADLVVLNLEDRTLSLLPGHGDGEFDEPQILSTIADAAEPEQVPGDLAVADLDDDGTDEVVVLNHGSFTDWQLLVRYGDDLRNSSSFPSPLFATGLSLDDFDGNRLFDALITFDGGTLGAVFLPDDGGGRGFSNFGGFQLRGLVAGVANAAADFAGSPLPDFVQLNLAANEFQVAVNMSNKPTPTVTATRTPLPTVTETGTPAPTTTATVTASATPTSTASPTATRSATATATPSATATATNSLTPSPSPTRTMVLDDKDSCTLVVPRSGRVRGEGFAGLLLVGLALAMRRRHLRR